MKKIAALIFVLFVTANCFAEESNDFSGELILDPGITASAVEWKDGMEAAAQLPIQHLKNEETGEEIGDFYTTYGGVLARFEHEDYWEK